MVIVLNEKKRNMKIYFFFFLFIIISAAQAQTAANKTDDKGLKQGYLVTLLCFI